MSLPRLLVFLAVFTLVLGGGHYYLWRRFVRDPELPQRWRQVLTFALLSLVGLLVVNMALVRSLPREITSPLAFGAFV